MDQKMDPNFGSFQLLTLEIFFGGKFLSKNFPAYPERNIPKRPQPTVYGLEFLSFGSLGKPGVCETGVCWGSLRFCASEKQQSCLKVFLESAVSILCCGLARKSTDYSGLNVKGGRDYITP